MTLHHLTDATLLQDTESLVKKEREVLTDLLRHLLEIDRRKLFSALGYKSLFEYCTRKLGYPEDQAYRRINAMRLMSDFSDEVREVVAAKVNTGVLNLSHLSLTQSHFRKEQAHTGERATAEMKFDLLSSLEMKSTREAEKEILSRSSQPVPVVEDQIKLLSPDTVEFRFQAHPELQGKIERLKGMLAHSQPHVSLGELIDQLCDLGMREWDMSQERPASRRSQELLGKKQSRDKEVLVRGQPKGEESSVMAQTKGKDASVKRQTNGKEASAMTQPNGKESPAAHKKHCGEDQAKREASQTKQNLTAIANSDTSSVPYQKERVHPEALCLSDDLGELQKSLEQVPTQSENIPSIPQPTKSGNISIAQRRYIRKRDAGRCHRCGSQYALEVDHIHPKALGGSNATENLRLLCRSCNQRAAVEAYGPRKMQRHFHQSSRKM